MDSKLEQAREWADHHRNISDHRLNAGVKAAAEVIQSLPDTVVDGDKLREVIADWGNREVTSDAYTLYRQVLALLPTPSLPTLAELIEAGNDPQKYQWMQCTVEDRGDDTFVIVMVREDVTKVLHPDGMHEVKRNSQVTPLPDLPKLEWPGSHADTITAESVEDVQAGHVDDFEPALPRPEDVPAGEPWIVLCGGRTCVGVRASGQEHVPWGIIRADGLNYQDVADSEITLISRLVPESKENA